MHSGCCFCHDDGAAITDRAVLTARLNRDTKLGIPPVANVRHISVAGDIAQIIVDWSIVGTGPDGKQVNLSGAACDIIRRATDGVWRAIYHPGTAMQ